VRRFDQFPVPAVRLHRAEEFLDRTGDQRLPDRLRTFGQELTVRVTMPAAQQALGMQNPG
jgi:hypothetical protein